MILKGSSRKYEILNELIKKSLYINISTGYFNANVFELLKEAFEHFQLNGHKIRIILGADTDVNQVILLNNIIKNKCLNEEEFINAFFGNIENLNMETLILLKDMLNTSLLEFRIGVSQYGIYHPKNYIFESKSGLRAITGSMNFSYSGVMKNFESVTYFSEYNDEHTREYNDEFNEVWNKEFGNVYVRPITDILLDRVEEVLSYKNGNIIFKDETESKQIELRDYQLECIDGLIENDMNGFLELATGTGKTFTTIYALKHYLENQFRVIHIIVPYKHLVTQWKEELKTVFGKSIELIEIHDESRNWKQKLSTLSYFRENKNVFLLFVDKSFFKTSTYFKYVRKDDDILVVDEAHNLTTNNLEILSKLNYQHRVALSASPHNYLEQERTDMLFDYFKGYKKVFGLKEAIENDYLTKYNYHPYLINLDSGEAKYYRDLKKEYIDGNKNDISLVNRMDEVLSKAHKKIDKFKSLIKENGLNHTLIYCQQGSLKNSQQSYIEYTGENILEVVNDARLEKITYEEKMNKRNEIIENFSKGDTNAILAIRCLDEGYDIPSVKDAYILNSTRNPKEYIQRRGRLLRKYKEKDITDIYDFILAIDNVILESEVKRFAEYGKLASNKEEVNSFKNNNIWEEVIDE